jgi:hypothetical protein
MRLPAVGASGRAAPPPAAGAPFSLEPDLGELDDDTLDDVFAGRDAPVSTRRAVSGRFGHEPPVSSAPLVPDARSLFEDAPAPRGGAAGFRSAPRRSGGLGGLLGHPALRAAAYAVAGIALVAVIVNLALDGGAAPQRVPAPAAQSPAAPVPTLAASPARPSAAGQAADRDAADSARFAAQTAVAAAERAARAAERARARAAAAHRRAAKARARRRAAARRKGAVLTVPVRPTPRVVQPPSAGSGGSGGTCEFGCIG